MSGTQKLVEVPNPHDPEACSRFISLASLEGRKPFSANVEDRFFSAAALEKQINDYWLKMAMGGGVEAPRADSPDAVHPTALELATPPVAAPQPAANRLTRLSAASSTSTVMADSEMDDGGSRVVTAGVVVSPTGHS